MTPQELAERFRQELTKAFGPSWSALPAEQERQLRLQIAQHAAAIDTITARQELDPGNADVYQARIEALTLELEARRAWLVHVVRQELPGEDEAQALLEREPAALAPITSWDEATGVELFTQDQLAIQDKDGATAGADADPTAPTADQGANLETQPERPQPVQDVAETNQVDEDTITASGPSTGVLGAPVDEAASVLGRTVPVDYDHVPDIPLDGPLELPTDSYTGPVGGSSTGESDPIPTGDAEPPKLAGAAILAALAYFIFG